MCKDVHDKEDYTLRYMATERIDQEGSDKDIIMIETYVFLHSLSPSTPYGCGCDCCAVTWT